MPLSTRRFFNGTPKIIDFGIFIFICSISAGLGFAIANSDLFVASKQGIRVEKQAIVNHEALKQALVINQSQQLEYERLKTEVERLAAYYPAVQPLAREFEEAEERLPQERLTELSGVVEKSAEVLGLEPQQF